MINNKYFKIFMGILISFMLLFVLFFNINVRQFLDAFCLANYYYTIPVIIIVFVGCFIRTLRWRWIIMPVKKISISSLFSATIIGCMANGLLPARAGELVRAHVIGKREGISRTYSFATIVVERLFDGLSILVVLVSVLFFIKIPVQKAVVTAALISLVVYSLIIMIVLMFSYKRESVVKTLYFLFHFLSATIKQKILYVMESMAEGFKIVERGHHLVIISLYSFLIWAITALGIYLMVVSFGYHISYFSSLFVLVLLTFAITLPSSPGFIGTFEVGMVYGLIVCSIPREIALSMTILYHGLNFVPLILLGLYYVWKEHISISGKDFTNEVSSKLTS